MSFCFCHRLQLSDSGRVLWCLKGKVCKQGTQSIPSQHFRKCRISLTAPCGKWQRGKESRPFSDTKHNTIPPAHSRASQLLLSFPEDITQILGGGQACLASHVPLIQYIRAWFEDQSYQTRGNQYQGMLKQSQIICQMIESEYFYFMLQVKKIYSSGAVGKICLNIKHKIQFGMLTVKEY